MSEIWEQVKELSLSNQSRQILIFACFFFVNTLEDIFRTYNVRVGSFLREHVHLKSYCQDTAYHHAMVILLHDGNCLAEILVQGCRT
jgi:hypothetical protein